MQSEDIYQDIRPYRDIEVTRVLSNLFKNREFIDTFARYKLGPIYKISPRIFSLIFRHRLANQFKGVSNVAEMQAVVRRYMDKLIQLTTSKFTVSGLDRLPDNEACLFISNHRDIAMDPAFINYALYSAGRQTARIAIGDNLLSKSWVSDIMRLNKSFIVKRSAGGPRELISAMRLLSNYINQSLKMDNAPVWLAQKEGRAKDGVDRTEPAVIKMLDLCRDKKKHSFSEHIESLSIVPVAISYELDPCDALKAQELYEIENTGCYSKDTNEDILSIGRGIAGYKGKVSVAFGKVISQDLSNPIEVSHEIDKQIIEMYQLFPNNVVAHQLVCSDKKRSSRFFEGLSVNESDRSSFLTRMSQLPDEHRDFAYHIYANPVRRWLELNE